MAEQISLTRTVTPSKAKIGIIKCIKTKRPVFLWGPPGIGKSDIVKQIGKEQGRKVIDIRLSLWEPTDIKGIPYYNLDKKTMEWAAPSELPSDPNSTDIVFLDELNTAAPATQAAAYQLIHNRQVGSYVLPKGVDLVAAGNRDNDKGVTYRMPSPLSNRFIHLELTTNYEDWKQWAVDNKVHDHVVGYIEFAKNDLYRFDPKSPSRAFATPRSWSFVSDLLEDDDLPEDSLNDLISGAIGEGIAAKFMAHRRISKDLPKPIDILNGVVKTCTIKEMSAMYSLTMSMCHELKIAYENETPNWNNLANNYIGFMMDNYPAEVAVLGVRTALTNYNLPFDTTVMGNFDKFYDQYGELVIRALGK